VFTVLGFWIVVTLNLITFLCCGNLPPGSQSPSSPQSIIENKPESVLQTFGFEITEDGWLYSGVDVGERMCVVCKSVQSLLLQMK
jgi:hypothetical protein